MSQRKDEVRSLALDIIREMEARSRGQHCVQLDTDKPSISLAEETGNGGQEAKDAAGELPPKLRLLEHALLLAEQRLTLPDKLNRALRDLCKAWPKGRLPALLALAQCLCNVGPRERKAHAFLAEDLGLLPAGEQGQLLAAGLLNLYQSSKGEKCVAEGRQRLAGSELEALGLLLSDAGFAGLLRRQQRFSDFIVAAGTESLAALLRAEPSALARSARFLCRLLAGTLSRPRALADTHALGLLEAAALAALNAKEALSGPFWTFLQSLTTAFSLTSSLPSQTPAKANLTGRRTAQGQTEPLVTALLVIL